MSLKNRIYRNMLGIVLFSACAVVLLFFYQLSTELPERIKNELSGTRITIVDNTGKVTYDNYSNTANMENHGNRQEIIDAFEKGSGSSQRYSETLGKQTYYFASKLNDNKVIRLAITTDGINTVILSVLPGLVAVLVIVSAISVFISSRLVKKIVSPINNISLDNENTEIYDELSPFVRKITEQKMQLSSQLTDLENKANTIKAITQNMNEGLVLLDKKGVVLSANKSVLSLFSHNEALVGKNILELTRNTQVIECVKSVLKGDYSDTITELLTKTYHVFASPVAGSGGVVLFLDITEKARSEKMRREFSANVSHELKTPLTIVSGYAEMIENGMAKTKDIQSFAGKIKCEAARLIALIEDIIKLSELDEKGKPVYTEQFDITEVAKTVAERLKIASDEKNVTLLVVGENILINGNRQMADEMLFNLIDNGIKYNKQGGSVTITLVKENDKTKITVCDTGIGIDKVHLDRIFERFYRIDKSRSKKTGGTGLGLSIVKHIAEYHGWKIGIDSKPNAGTKIYIII